jgi:hypothetical protein
MHVIKLTGLNAVLGMMEIYATHALIITGHNIIGML